MTVLRLTDAGEAAGLGAFLGRLVRWDKAAVVRLQGEPAPGGGAVAVFGRAPFGEVLAVRACQLAELPVPLDVTVAAGQLLEGVRDVPAEAVVPPGVTGPAWAGLLPPRGGWRRIADLGPERLRETAGAVVAEFRSRTEALPAERRTRQELDGLAEEIWSRPLDGTGLPLRAVHAAHALGFLRPVRAVVGAGARSAPPVAVDEGLALLGCGPWLRLRTPHGSVLVRDRGAPGLSLRPVR